MAVRVRALTVPSMRTLILLTAGVLLAVDLSVFGSYLVAR